VSLPLRKPALPREAGFFFVSGRVMR